MAGRKKELLVLILDVGDGMRQHMEAASRMMFLLVQSKLLFKPNDEVCVVFCGTTGTSNELNREMEESGQMGQYTNISVEFPLGPTQLSTVSLLRGVEAQGGRADFLDAIVVALDILIRRMDKDLGAKAILKRVLLVSNLVSEVQPLSQSLQESMLSNLTVKDIKIEVVSIDYGTLASDELTKKQNTALLSGIASGSRILVKHAEAEGELLGMFPVKEVTPTSMYKGPLSLGNNLLNLKVNVYKKVARASLPTLQPYSNRSSDPNATHSVKKEVEYKTTGDPDNPVALEERIKAFKYGKQLVPLSQDEEACLTYDPEKDFQILGFVDAEQVPRDHYVKDPYCVLPDDDSAKLGISALCTAMTEEKKVAIVRVKLRANSSLFLGVLTPFRPSPSSLDCFIMNTLPYAEDIRYYSFMSLDAVPERVPNEEQLDAVQKVIDTMDLSSNGKEKLRSDTLANPNLQKFYWCLGNKAIDPEYAPSIDDRMVSAVFEPHLGEMPGAKEALEECAKQFSLIPSSQKHTGDTKIQEEKVSSFKDTEAVFDVAKAGQESVTSIGTTTPILNFYVLLEKGMIGKAMEGMKEAIQGIVEQSIGSRSYQKALQTLTALRKGCAQNSKALEFNDILCYLRDLYKPSATRSDFWERVLEEKVTLIHKEEVESSNITPSGAQEFLTAGTQTMALQQEDVEMVDDDEFEGMD